MIRSHGLVCIVLAMLFACAWPARAQVGFGQLVLSATGPDGRAATGATFDVSVVDRRGASRAVTLEGTGSAAVTLAPGSYRVVVQLAGFRTGERVVYVAPGSVVRLAARLAVASGMADTQVRVADRFDLAHETVFTPDLLRDLPSSRTVWSLLETAHPFLITDRMDNGGLGSAEPARIGGYGSSWTQTAFRLDGLNVTEPQVLGTPVFYPDLDVLEAVGVDSALQSVESAGPGPVISLVPRRPGDRWTGTIQAVATPKSLQASNQGAPAIARFESWTDTSALAGGPLSGSRLGLVASARVTGAQRLERDDVTPVTNEVRSFYAHLVGAQAAGGEARAIAAFTGTTRPYAGRARFADRHVHERGRALTLQSTWERARGASAWSVAAGYSRASTQANVAAGALGGAMERLIDGPPLALAEWAPGVQQRWTLATTLAPSVRQWGNRDHVLRLGATFGGASAEARSIAQPAFAELVNGQPARVWDVRAAAASRWTSLDLSGFLSDQIAVTPSLTVHAGLRFDHDRGSAAGASNTIHWTDVSPRVSLRWHPIADQRFAITTGYGWYQQRLPLNYFAVGDPSGPTGVAYRWDDRDGDRRYTAAELTAVAAVGACCTGGQANTIDPDLRRATTREFLIGVEYSLGPWRGRMTGIDSPEYDAPALVNVGVTPADYSVSFVRDPGVDITGDKGYVDLPLYSRNPASFLRDRYLLTNPAGSGTRYQGFELEVERDLTGRWYLRFGGAAYRVAGIGANRGFRAEENDQGVLGELYLTPNAQSSGRGRLFFDRAFIMKLMGAYHAPGDVRVGLVARYQDGQPFSRVVFAGGLGQGADVVEANPRGRQRYTFTFTLDARVEKEFTVGRGGVSALFEVFNLLDTRLEVEEDIVSGPAFRTSTAFQPPRAVRLGVRLRF